MKLKIDESGNAVLQDGKPVYVYDDGKEIAHDAAATVQTISRLNAEAKSHRERAEAAEKVIKKFEGIDDPVAAIKAMETVANLDAKKLVDAGEIEKVKAEISKAYQAQVESVTSERDTFKQQLYDEKIGGSFARSKLIAEKMAIPSDLVQARFGNAFKVENGAIVAYDHSGNKIYSRVKPGEIADFDEALESLVDAYPHKDSILKSSGASGGGASNSNTSTGSKTIKLTELNAMRPKDRAAAMKNGATIID